MSNEPPRSDAQALGRHTDPSAAEIAPQGRPQDAPGNGPTTEPPVLPFVRPDVPQQVGAALDALAARPVRNEKGQWAKDGEGFSGTTLERSAAFWQTVEPVKQQLIDSVRHDLALEPGAASEAMQGVIEMYVESRLFRTSLFVRLVEVGGPLTSRGKTKSLYRAYLSALDRELKLAQVLGLERKPKRTQTLADLLNEKRDV